MNLINSFYCGEDRSPRGRAPVWRVDLRKARRRDPQAQLCDPAKWPHLPPKPHRATVSPFMALHLNLLRRAPKPMAERAPEPNFCSRVTLSESSQVESAIGGAVMTPMAALLRWQVERVLAFAGRNG
jgi:hypothetical protein